jgi:glycosyltransferase involved in cell wall biosynthesis
MIESSMAHSADDNLVSIVIPAHNEASVIDRCLNRLVRGGGRFPIEVIVVCNGCTDNTAAIAKRFGGSVRVIETDVSSKSHALNLGDEASRGFPRFFLDADVLLDPRAIDEVSDVLCAGRFLVAAPSVEFDLDASSWAVRAFYRIWGLMPYMRKGMVGSGLYAMSREGRSRFDRFPSITADDGFVHRCFNSDERTTVDTCSFKIKPPRDLSSLISIKTRAYFGMIELEHHFPSMKAEAEASHTSALLRLGMNPLNWPALAIYAYVRLASRARARRRWRAGDHQRWERDESSRVGSD